MSSKLHQITTGELLNKINDSSSKIIDVRPVDAYNGWQLKNEKRGGHIQNAKSLPFKWTKYIDWIEMVHKKQILPEHQVIIYGYEKDEIDQVAKRFFKSGYNKVFVYYDFINEWIANEKPPMQQLERFKNLVSAEWVNELISGGKPQYYDNNKFIIVHSHYRNRDAYLSGHIPGAIDMDTMALEAPETWNRRSPKELKEALEKHGITADTTVVLYGKFMFPDNADEFPGSAAGDIGAIRNAFIMMYAGVKDVRILNGGFQSWQDEGY
ncbi:MAG TPA: rhodanese-like domain-containing protein, partial [Bacteroidales bacterium]|nr:rhodanese-like domain-containing protein [Bacteroidales bacterium]